MVLPESADSIARRITLRELRLLLAVARSGSILKAASEVGLTQPAVSRCISDLESTLRVRLFDRTNRGVAATPQGEILLRRATGMFDELRHAVDEIGALTDGAHGNVRVGATPTMCAGLVPKAVNLLHAQKPNFRFEVGEFALDKLVGEVLARALDIGVGRNPTPHDDLLFDKLFDDRLFIVAGASHPLSKRRSLALADTAKYPWVLPSADGAMMQQLRDAFRRQRLELPRAVATTMSVVMRYELIAAGRLLTVMYGSVLRFGTAPSRVRVLPLDLPVSMPVGLIRQRRRTLGRSSELFMETVREMSKALHSLDVRQLMNPI